MENVMSKIGETAIKTCRCATRATEKIAREIKLKAKMSDNKSQIRELYEDIGRRVYENHIVGEKLDERLDLKKDCEMIDKLANEIEDIRRQILNLKDLKQCQKCYYEIDLEFHYCPNCGYEQELTEGTKKNDGPATIETIDDNVNLKKSKNDNLEELNKKQSEKDKYPESDEIINDYE